MRDRCNNPKNKRWKHYGGRGIKFCERWNDFAKFIEDIGERPPGKTLDRIDNDGDYEPGNVRWATSKEQTANQSLVFQETYSYNINNIGRNTHGKYGTRVYRTWDGIVQRCNNPKASHCNHYGARGIEVDKYWRENFLNFYKDMGDPLPGYELHRLNHDGNYEPKNCVWAIRTRRTL